HPRLTQLHSLLVPHRKKNTAAPSSQDMSRALSKKKTSVRKVWLQTIHMDLMDHRHHQLDNKQPTNSQQAETCLVHSVKSTAPVDDDQSNNGGTAKSNRAGRPKIIHTCSLARTTLDDR